MNSVTPYKVCDSSRRTRHVVLASGTITSLIEQATNTFQRQFQHIVLESDGCELSSDLALTAFSRELLMLLEPGEIWIPVGFYATDTQTLDKSEVSGLQDTSTGQIVLSTIQNMQATDDASLPILQTLNMDSNVVTIMPNPHHPSVPDPIAMQLLADVVADQEITLQQPSTSLQKPVAGCSVNVQEDNEDLLDQASAINSDDPIDENQSPNSTMKRSGTVEVQKSSKKHASTEMKFRCFEINWDKLSDNILTKLNSMQEFKVKNPDESIPTALRMTKSDTTSLVNNIVDQLRAIDSQIKADVMGTVAKQLTCKYPCLEPVDDDGFINGKGHVVIKHHMISRNIYLNRSNSSEPKIPASNKGRNVRAGTLKSYWKNSNKECEKEVLSKLRRDEPVMLTDEFLEASQAFVRYRLSESKDLPQLLSEYPVLRRRVLMNYHFAQATGVDVDNLRKYYGMKRTKIIKYSDTAGRKFAKINNDCSDLDVFRFLACLVGEKLSDLVVNKEIGTRIDDIQLKSAGPLLVSVEMGQDTCMYYVYADQTRLSEGTVDVICAIQDLLCVQFVHNFKYIKAASKFLEFVQQYFLKITPSSGSKSNAYRVGNQQRVVQKVIDCLSTYEFK